MSWKGSLVMMSLGGSPDMVSWLSLDIVTVSADRECYLTVIPEPNSAPIYEHFSTFLSAGWVWCFLWGGRAVYTSSSGRTSTALLCLPAQRFQPGHKEVFVDDKRLSTWATSYLLHRFRFDTRVQRSATSFRSLAVTEAADSLQLSTNSQPVRFFFIFLSQAQVFQRNSWTWGYPRKLFLGEQTGK